MLCLLAFAAIARFRTPKFRDMQREQWGEIYSYMQEVQTGINAASLEQRAAMVSMPRLGNAGPGMNMDEVAHLRDYPIQTFAAPMLKGILDGFVRMNVAILCTTDPVGFVTSDQPCVWIDPEAYKRPPAYRGVGLTSKSIEVSMPISPTQCLFISHAPAWHGYMDVSLEQVDEINARHIGACSDAFVARRNDVRDVWFQKHPLPEGAWEYPEKSVAD